MGGPEEPIIFFLNGWGHPPHQFQSSGKDKLGPISKMGRLLVALARGRGHFRHPKGGKQYHEDRITAAVALGAQTCVSDHGGDGQRDRAHRLSGSDPRADPSSFPNHMKR